ncbi:MAG: glutamate--cysteine ligase [Pseudonocardia sp.]|nr:glutamate--cysteine ligase [Pseudonocardia sp.]
MTSGAEAVPVSGAGASAGASARRVGVEEELLVVDPVTGQARAQSSGVLRFADDATTSTELQREQVEVETRPCRSVGELAIEVGRRRREIAEAARRNGVEIAALATSPLPVEPSVSPGGRYQRMAQRFAATARETLTCGCHVHVEVGSDSEAVDALNRIRPWLPVVLALSSNSPFWQGEDSGYASYRSQVWARWPSAGPPGEFSSADEYHATVTAMVATETLLDEGMIYFDARLSRSYPTVEVRVADVCLRAEDTVLIAALTRALVETAAGEHRDGVPTPAIRSEVLRLATWQAGRSGLGGRLVHPRDGSPAPAPAVIAALVEYVRPALEQAGEYPEATERLDTVLSRGTGADQQRSIYQRRGQLSDIVTAARI